MDRKTSRSIPFLLAGAVVFGAAVTACSGSAPAEEANEGRPVEIVTVASEPIPQSYALSGTLQAGNEAVLSFETGGRVVEPLASESDAVQQGELLASLDAEQYELQLERAAAAMRQAQAAVDQAGAAVRSASAGVASAEETDTVQSENAVKLAQSAYEKAQTDLQRGEALYAEGFLAESELESLQLAFVQAETNLEQAKTQSRQSGLGKDSAQASLEQAQAAQRQAEATYGEAAAAYEQAELALSKARLVSPIGGIVLETFVDAEQLVSAGQPAYRIGSLERLKVVLPVPDADVKDWKEGQTVAVSLYGEVRTGTVSNVFSSTNAGSGSVNVEVTVPNPNGDWLPGQVVQAERTDSGREGILVPVEAVVRAGAEPYVFKEVDGIAVKTAVTIGDMNRNKLEIVGGLAPGDRIVARGAGQLFDGDALRKAEELTSD